jgi:CRISPR/Cas system-associated exonuclease Cas4 (RecB family)
MTTILTKSAYLQFLKCPREFWLAHHRPDLFEPVDSPLYRHLRRQGYVVQQLARQLDEFLPNREKSVEFEREFKSDALYAKSDVVVTDLAGSLSIFEIKSSSRVKPEHLYDIAFQKMAAEESGAGVYRCYVVTVDTEYVLNGQIDPNMLFTVNDVTDEVREIEIETAILIGQAFTALETEPARTISGYCGDKLDCAFIRHHFPDLPEYTVFDISRIHSKKLDELIESNIIDIADIAPEFPLSEKQRRQVTVAQSGAADIDREAIKERMDTLVYPLHFLDYETFSFAVPQFAGIRPFQKMAFQFSLHTISEPGGECRHSHFLSEGGGDPAREMAHSLRDAIGGGIGTVIVWSQGFEKTVNKETGEMYPEFAEFFSEINDKTFDLRKIFSEQLYMHPDFKGRDSIKKVTPVLVPHLSYESLEISEGMIASIRWFHMVNGKPDDEERQAILDALRKYCRLDTWAMVEIFNVLKAL